MGMNKQMKLEEIGFYSLTDERARTSSAFSQMKRCEMIIIEACNFKCPYCRGLSSDVFADRKVKMMTLAEVKAAIDLWCVPVALENIRFSGGEPTLHPDIVEIVAYAKAKGIKRIAISSNGYSDFGIYKELVEAGCNDFSISLDACCASDGNMMAGNVGNVFTTVTENIRKLSELTYVTVGVVLTEDNISKTVDIVKYADGLGVADIRIIPSAQFNKAFDGLDAIGQEILDRHPILKYRVENFKSDVSVRGLSESDNEKCAIVLDDSVVAGKYHYPCVIYFREKGWAIGEVNYNMRNERKEWFEKHDCYEDKICRKNCLDACVFYNNRYKEFHQDCD